MATSRTSAMAKVITKVIREASPNHGGTDGELLGAFVERRDSSAFAELVRRHGPMVLGVCLRLLRHSQDAEDAFQATFLALARKAGSVLPRNAVGNWLYGVARQTAVRARAVNMKRRGRESLVPAIPESAVSDPGWDDLAVLLDEELARLPDHYRAVVVLCDIEGRTRASAAACLQCPEGSVSSRLSRARAMLARRLAKRGVTLSTGTLALLVGQNATPAAVPVSLANSTVEAAGLVAAGTTLTGAVSAAVANLTDGVLKAMLIAKLKTLALSVAMLGIVGMAGFAGFGRADGQVSDKPATKTTVRPPAPREVEKPRVEEREAVKPITVQLKIAAPADMIATPQNEAGKFDKSQSVRVPARLDLAAGKTHRLKLSDIAGRPGLELYPALEIPEPSAKAGEYLSTQLLTIEFTAEDFDIAVRGKSPATTVICLTDDQPPEIRMIASPETADPVAAARKRGTILCVVRTGNIDLEPRKPAENSAKAEQEALDALKKMHAEFERDKDGVVIGVRLHPEGEQLTDAIPHLRRLPKVIRVAFYASVISPEGFLALATLPTLSEVEVYATRPGPGPVSGPGLFGGPCPRLAWDKLPKLRTIRLTGSGIGDEQLEDVAAAVAVRNLFVVEAGVSEKGLARLRALKGLEMLSVQSSKVNGDGVKALAGIEGLKELTLCANDIGRDGFRHLGTMTALTYLNLESTKATDADTAQLAPLTNLTDLDLGYNTALTDDGLRHLAGLKRLIGLRLYETKVTDAGVSDLKKAIPKLNVHK